MEENTPHEETEPEATPTESIPSEPSPEAPAPGAGADVQAGAPRRKSSKKWLWGCLGCGCLTLVAAAVVGIIIAVSGGVAIFGWLSGPSKSVDGFMTAMKTKQYAKAYTYLAAARKKEMTLSEFETVIKENPEVPKRYEEVDKSSYSSTNIKNDRATVKGTVTFKDGSKTSITVELVKEKDEWKIESLEGLSG